MRSTPGPFVAAAGVQTDKTSESLKEFFNELNGILKEYAAKADQHSANEQKIGDYYAACMDEAAVEKLGAKPIEPDLAAIDALKSVKDVAPLAARLHLEGETLLFGSGSQRSPHL